MQLEPNTFQYLDVVFETLGNANHFYIINFHVVLARRFFSEGFLEFQTIFLWFSPLKTNSFVFIGRFRWWRYRKWCFAVCFHSKNFQKNPNSIVFPLFFFTIIPIKILQSLAQYMWPHINKLDTHTTFQYSILYLVNSITHEFISFHFRTKQERNYDFEMLYEFE